MGEQLTPERLNALANEYDEENKHHVRWWGEDDPALARYETAAATLHVAAWLATPGNYVVELVVNDETRALLGYQAMTGGDSANLVGRGPTALAAVLDAIGVRP